MAHLSAQQTAALRTVGNSSVNMNDGVCVRSEAARQLIIEAVLFSALTFVRLG